MKFLQNVFSSRGFNLLLPNPAVPLTAPLPSWPYHVFTHHSFPQNSSVAFFLIQNGIQTQTWHLCIKCWVIFSCLGKKKKNVNFTDVLRRQWVLGIVLLSHKSPAWTLYPFRLASQSSPSVLCVLMATCLFCLGPQPSPHLLSFQSWTFLEALPSYNTLSDLLLLRASLCCSMQILRVHNTALFPACM